MKKILIILGLFLSASLFAQIDTVDVGTSANDHTGDPLRSAFIKLNSNDQRFDSVFNAQDDTVTFDVVTADSIYTRVLDYSPPHGAMIFNDSAYVLACASGVWSKVTNATDSLYSIIDQDDITFDGDTITITVAGDYLLNVNMSFIGTASDIWNIAIYKNNTLTRFKSHRKTSNADTGYFGIFAYLDNLAIGDDISFYMMNSADNDDATLVSSQVVIDMLHPR